MKRTVQWIVIAVAAGAILAFISHMITPDSAIAHGGGLDKYGCHRDNKAGNYHCHRGSCQEKTFTSQAEMLKSSCSRQK